MSVDNHINEIEEADVSAPTHIPFSFYLFQNRKTTKLLANAEGRGGLSGRSKWYDYGLSSPVLISTIEIICEDYSDYGEFEFKFTDFFEGEKKGYASPSSGKISIEIGRICSAFSFKPPPRYFSEPKLIELHVFGYEVAELPNVLEVIRNIDSYKASAIQEIQESLAQLNERASQVHAIEAQRSDLRSQIQTLKTQHTRETNKLDSVRTTLSETTVKNEAMVENFRKGEQELKDVRAQIALTSTERDGLQKEVSSLETKLKELKGNVNLFPSELSEFVKQGQQNIKVYYGYAAVPIVLIFAMFIILVNGSVTLTTLITGNDDVNILALAVSRAPFVTVSLAIITA